MRARTVSALVVLLAAWPAPADAAGRHPPRACDRGTTPRAGAFHPRTVPPGAVYVHDGDTIYVAREPIRLRGIDAPELDQPGGAAAKWRLVQLLRAGPVTIVPRLIDAYCRTVADVHAGGLDVAEVLRREGFAKPRVWRPRRPR